MNAQVSDSISSYLPSVQSDETAAERPTGPEHVASAHAGGQASPDWSVFQAQLLCVGRHLDAEKNQDSLSPAAEGGTSLHLAFRHPSEVQTLVPGQVQEDKVQTGLTVWRFLPITGDQSCFLQTGAAASEPRPPGSHVIAVVLQQIPHPPSAAGERRRCS